MAHAFKIMAGGDIKIDEISDRLSVDKNRYQTVLQEQNVEPTMIEKDSMVGVPKHIYLQLHFNDSETSDEIAQLLSEGTLYESEWLVVDYHSCEHDRGGGACESWAEIVRRGSVPESL